MSASQEIKDFTKDILNVFVSDITDKVFLEIQSNRDLMQKYMAFIGNKQNNLTQSKQYPDLRGLNSQVAQAICELLHLETTGKKNENPGSSLIYSHDLLKLK